MAATMTQNFKTLGDNWMVMSYPKIELMMSGVACAGQNNTGAITLVYTDGSRESRECDRDIETFDNLFSIVSFVQGGRGTVNA